MHEGSSSSRPSGRAIGVAPEERAAPSPAPAPVGGGTHGRGEGLGLSHATDQSRRWFERAGRVLAGGISSSARATTTGELPYPQYLVRGQGPRVWDADGNQFIDYLLSYGSIVLGHADAGQTEALKQQIDVGTMFGTCNTVEVELAEQICRMAPCAELVRFANSGSEAMSGAVRAARGFTGRDKVLKFEGHYHGWVDVLAVSNRPTPQEAGPFEAPHSRPHSLGTPAGVVNDVVICPWNEPDVLEDILDRHAGEIAAVVAEPIVANNACLLPKPGYLGRLREACDRRGVLLIFDEIVTGFRCARGGAQEYFGVTPDLAVYSKALGGGLPISAFAGRRAIMEWVASNRAKHGGTYNGNPLCAASALHTLRALDDAAVLARLQRAGDVVIERVRRAARDCGVPCTVQGPGSMFQIVFGIGPTEPLHHYRDLGRADMARYGAFRHALLGRGVHANSSGLACWFTSAAHGEEEAQRTEAAIDAAMRSVA